MSRAWIALTDMQCACGSESISFLRVWVVASHLIDYKSVEIMVVMYRAQNFLEFAGTQSLWSS